LHYVFQSDSFTFVTSISEVLPRAGRALPSREERTMNHAATSTSHRVPAASRISAIEPPYPADAADELGRWMPPGAAEAGMDPLALFRTLCRHLPLARAMRPLGSHLLSRALTVEKREREIVILRVCARCRCTYEWGVHVTVFGARAGLSRETIGATWSGTPSDFAASDAVLVRLVDELHDSGRVSDELWQALAEIWSAEQVLELLALVGWYHLISYVANGANVPPERWAEEIPGSENGRQGESKEAHLVK
jgi:alkylhydroperoxidase family enzyme